MASCAGLSAGNGGRFQAAVGSTVGVYSLLQDLKWNEPCASCIPLSCASKALGAMSISLCCRFDAFPLAAASALRFSIEKKIRSNTLPKPTGPLRMTHIRFKLPRIEKSIFSLGTTYHFATVKYPVIALVFFFFHHHNNNNNDP